MNEINELSLNEQLKRGTTRRFVVTTGVKVAYAVPLVAATVKLTTLNASAICGGDTPYQLPFGGSSLCCGCCPQTDDALGARSIFDEAFEACQKLLADNGVTCPLADEPGGDVTRVCIAPDSKLSR
jgi:hypothetical protein